MTQYFCLPRLLGYRCRRFFSLKKLLIDVHQVLFHNGVIWFVVREDSESGEVVVSRIKVLQVIPDLKNTQQQLLSVRLAPNFLFKILTWIMRCNYFFTCLKEPACKTTLIVVLTSSLEIFQQLVFFVFTLIFLLLDSQTVVKQIFKPLNNCYHVIFLVNCKFTLPLLNFE